MLELDTLEDLELAQWDPVSEVFDESGQERAAEGIGFAGRFRRRIGRQGVGMAVEWKLVDGAFPAQQAHDAGVGEHAEVFPAMSAIQLLSAAWAAVGAAMANAESACSRGGLMGSVDYGIVRRE